MAVVIETTLGDITVDLFLEERPRACLNFLKLCKLKYYNYNLFHTIERDFIAQTGDPTGVGDGGESVWGVVEGPHKRFFEAESLPKIKHSVPGLLSLVSVGKSMVGSQFFFTLGADLTSLDGVHCVIGEVVEGREILIKLNEAIVDEKFRPYQDIRVTHTVILDDPFSDPRGFQVPSRSPSPTTERMQNGRIGADEDIDDTAGKTQEEIQEMLAEREAKARATILEIVGDLPDADIAPPENVLFVCKLNPVTTDDDLEIIFSRFGKVKGCEVIRDKMSGDSLQYAFVEFEDQKACEAAYFKMDNVLIDDRRIHVDFSQSVSRVQWRGKGRGLIHKDGKDRKLNFNDLRGNNQRGGADGNRRNRDQSQSPGRRPPRNDYSGGQKRSSQKGNSPQSKRRDEERTTRRNSRQRSGSRDNKIRGQSDSRRRQRSRSPVKRRRDSPARRSSPRDRRSSPRDRRQQRHQSPLRDRRRLPDEEEHRRSSPGNDRRRFPDGSSSRNDIDRRRNFEDSSRFRDQRRRLSPDRGNGHDKRGYLENSRPTAVRQEQQPSRTVKSSSSKTGNTKSQKKDVKSKKKKKTSSSSSESESESSSSSETSSSSSSSSSSDGKRKKSKKSKKSKKPTSNKRKSKKQAQKKSKRRHSSSSSD